VPPTVHSGGGRAIPVEHTRHTQSKILTEPHTGKEKPIPAAPQGQQILSREVAKRHRLGELEVPTLAARVLGVHTIPVGHTRHTSIHAGAEAERRACYK